MKILNFGEVLKKLRLMEGITQSDLVDRVSQETNGESSIDSVSISRWENNVISPCHRRQVEFVQSIGYSLNQLIDSQSLLVSQDQIREYLVNKVVQNSFWDFSADQIKFEDISILSIDNADLTSYLFVNKISNIPIAHLCFHIETGTLTKGEKYLVIDTLYCTCPYLLLDLINIFMGKLISREIDGVVYKSKNRSTPLNKFVKSIGFKVIDKKNNKYISVLTANDVLYNQTYFAIACCYIGRVVV